MSQLAQPAPLTAAIPPRPSIVKSLLWLIMLAFCLLTVFNSTRYLLRTPGNPHFAK